MSPLSNTKQLLPLFLLLTYVQSTNAGQFCKFSNSNLTNLITFGDQLEAAAEKKFNENCEKFLGPAPDFKPGEYSSTVFADRANRFEDIFENSSDLNKWCPNFAQQSPEQKKTLALLTLKSISQIEASCTASKINPNATSGIAYGLFQMEGIVARLNAGRSEACYPALTGSEATTYRNFLRCSKRKRIQKGDLVGVIPKSEVENCAKENSTQSVSAADLLRDDDQLDAEGNIKCATSILRTSLLSSSKRLFGTNQYWEHLKRGSTKPPPEPYCGGSIGALIRASEANSCIDDNAVEESSELAICLKKDLQFWGKLVQMRESTNTSRISQSDLAVLEKISPRAAKTNLHRIQNLLNTGR